MEIGREVMNRRTALQMAATAALILGFASATAYGQDRPLQSNTTNSPAQSAAPTPVRNDVAKQDREILVLRNHRLRAGGHEQFYQASRDDVWPYFERMGARVVGQWKIFQTDAVAPQGVEDVYRLVRYTGIEHWQATRYQRSTAGDGPAFEKDQKGRKERAGIEVGSKGAFFLQGETAPGGPYYMPTLREKYELLQSGVRPPSGEPQIPVRMDVARPGVEIVVIRYQRIAKGAFDRFVDLTRAHIWPWEEKLGARPIGQWKVIFPALPGVTERSRGASLMTQESPDYDEVITMTRYASKAHYDEMAPDAAVYMGGNGPDWRAWTEALQAQRKLTTMTSIEIAQGLQYQSPPNYLPGLPERYRRVE
jgi:hypothetical protein